MLMKFLNVTYFLHKTVTLSITLFDQLFYQKSNKMTFTNSNKTLKTHKYALKKWVIYLKMYKMQLSLIKQHYNKENDIYID